MGRYLLIYNNDKFYLKKLYNNKTVCSSSSLNIILTFLQDNRISSKNVFLPSFSLYSYVTKIVEKRADIIDLCS